MSFTAVIVGRPNVGKSTLFNRLVGRRAALVAPVPGVTRDRREGDGRIGPLRFRVIDTAGLEEADPDALTGRMMAQTARAIDEADVILFLVDGRAGLTPVDRHFASALRQSNLPIVLIANKCEGEGGTAGLMEAYALGLGDPIPLSAEHGDGLGDLYDALAPFDIVGEEDGASEDLRIAVVGRPNVGKSTLVNRLVDEERVVTGPEPGVTRDAIAVRWAYEGRTIALVDTAGLRRRPKVTSPLESLAAQDATRALGRAAVALVLLDATEPIGRQDLTIAARTEEEGRAAVIVLNKWDLVEDRPATLRTVREQLASALSQAKGIAIIPCSALTGEGIPKLMPAVLRAFERWNTRVPTAALNRWLAEAADHHPPPLVAGRRVKLRYVTQVKARPPTFALFTSRPQGLPDSYKRYLTNDLRARFDLGGVPIRLHFRRGKNPYASS